MEKKIWVKPEMNLMQFAANDYVSTCLASYSASLFCALPNDPSKLDTYNYASCGEDDHINGGCHNTYAGKPCQSFHDSDGNWHGTCASWANTAIFDGNSARGNEGENDIWDVQIGSKIDDFDQSSFTFDFSNGIGSLIDDLSTGGHYLVSWLSGKFNKTEWRRHYGVANITNVEVAGNPNRS